MPHFGYTHNCRKKLQTDGKELMEQDDIKRRDVARDATRVWESRYPHENSLFIFSL